MLSTYSSPDTLLKLVRQTVGFWTLVVAVVLGASVVSAQGKTDKTDVKKAKIPPPEELTLITGGDGLQLSLTYYPSNKGKSAIPVILLHEWKSSRSDFAGLAPYLQKYGHAVIVPDLRGHGDSKTRARGRDLDAAKMSTLDFSMIVPADMEAIREFIRAKNNAGELNINKLCVVGTEMGASVAMQFAVYDWTYGPHGNGYYGAGFQMGQFVKALVLISPKWSFRGIKLSNLMNNQNVCSRISVMIIVGKEKSSAVSDAKRIYKMFQRYHPEPKEENKADKKDLYYGALPTSLQGAKMLQAAELGVNRHVAKFIDMRLLKSSKSKTFSWKERKRPHE
jgi:pimeloyl-ACP methyl ester carboxylesterase